MYVNQIPFQNEVDQIKHTTLGFHICDHMVYHYHWQIIYIYIYIISIPSICLFFFFFYWNSFFWHYLYIYISFYNSKKNLIVLDQKIIIHNFFFFFQVMIHNFLIISWENIFIWYLPSTFKFSKFIFTNKLRKNWQPARAFRTWAMTQIRAQAPTNAL